MGLMSATKFMKNRKKFKWKDFNFKKRMLGTYVKVDPLEGKNQAKGLVISKVQREA